MAIIKKYSPKENLSNFSVLVKDTDPNSEYFRITEFKDTFTAGRNGFLIAGSEYLKETTEIKIEILDVNGDPIYFEPGNGVPEYYEGISKPVSVYIYQDTPIGIGKITVLGELKQYIENGVVRNVPSEWQGAYNVKWEKTFQINKNLNNTDRVRFYRKPKIEIDEITKPVLSTDVLTITQAGTAVGLPLTPGAGTALSSFSQPTSYRIKIDDDTNWTGSVVNSTISFPNLGFSTEISDVVNNKEIILNTPYSIADVVSSFAGEDYSVTFNYVEGSNDVATALTGSYGRIKITDLKTFIGDVARVKVYRKSQSQIGDYEFIQEILLDSNELLVDYENPASNQELYGNITTNRINEYWVTSSNDITAQFNQDFLYDSVRLDSTSSVQNFYTSKSIDVTDGIEYTLNLNTRKSGSVDSESYIRVFLSGSIVNGFTSSYSTDESGNILTNQQIEIIPSFVPTAQTQSALPNNWTLDYGVTFTNLRPGRYYEVVVSSSSTQNASAVQFGSDLYSVSESVAQLAITDGFFAIAPEMQFTNFWRVNWQDVTNLSSYSHFNFQIFDKYDSGGGKFLNGISDYSYEFNLQDTIDSLPIVDWADLPTFDDIILANPIPYVSDSGTVANCRIGSPFDGVEFALLEYPLEISGLVSGSLYKVSNIFTSSTDRRNASAYIGSDFYDMVNNSFTASSEIMNFDKAYAILYLTSSYQPEDDPFAQIAFKIEKVDDPRVYGSIDIGSGSLNTSTKLSDNPSSGSNYLSLPICGYIGYWPRPSVETTTLGTSSDALLSTNALITASQRVNYAQIEQDIVLIDNDTKYLQKYNVSENFIVDNLDNAQVYFEVSGSGWHISDVSLKAAQEKGYSPDEITFIQSIPKTLPKERFDFRFEFYDINNNYIPVNVEATKLFDGGNLSSFQKSIELVPSSLYFSFDSASNPQPPSVIQFTTITNLITGSVTYTSASYDVTGSLILSESYGTGLFPGTFTAYSDSGSILTANNFTGSNPNFEVQYIEFTAEAEGLTDSVIITRVLDGRGGVNYDIRSYNGTVIKNKSTNQLEFQAIRIDGVNQIELSNSLPQEAWREYKLKVLSSSLEGDFYIPLSSASAQAFLDGITVGTLGSGQIDYNVKVGRDAVDDQLVLYLMEGDTENDILTSIIISDLQDGLGTGYVEYDTDQFTINLGVPTASLATFNPPSGSATGFFYERGTTTSPVSATIQILPSMSVNSSYQPDYYMFYTTSVSHPKISIVATNEDGLIIDEGYYTSSLFAESNNPLSQSRQLNVEFTYTEDYTGATITTSKNFTIIQDGVPGQDAVEVILDPANVVLSGDELGTVYNYSPARTILGVKQGTQYLTFQSESAPGTFTASISLDGISVGEITTSSVRYETEQTQSFPPEYIQLKSHSNMNAATASIVYDLVIYPYPIVGRESITTIPITKTQLFTKSNDGVNARNVKLATTSDVITFDGDGVLVSPLGDIILTATTFNTLPTVYYKFYRDSYAYTGWQTDNTFTIGSGDFDDYIGETVTWRVEIVDGSSTLPVGSRPVVGQDEVTITGIKSGAESYSVILTNENSAVNVAVDGDVDLTGTGTEIRAYKGAIEMAHVSSYTNPQYNAVGDYIGSIGEFSSSIYYKPAYLVQTDYPSGNPATIDDLDDWTDPQTNVSGFIVYKVDIEDGRATFFKTQSFAVQFEGAIGPGIVMRGEWTGSVDYIFDVEAKRRDAVMREINGDVHYWATTTDLVDAGSPPYTEEPIYNLGSPPSQGDIDAGGWQYLGMQEFFVAAKIAIFEESFVKNTINVGIPPLDKPNANIAIVGGTSEPYIAIGQQGTQGYNQEGIWLGINEDGTNGTYGMMSLKGTVTGGSYNALTWDGETLTIRGAIRQLDSGTPEGRVLGAWQDAYVYLENDIVTYNGQTWQATSSHTSNLLGGGSDGVPGIGPWVVAAQAGTSGTNGPAGTSGAAAKSVRLTSEAYIIQYDADGNNPSPSGTIKLEASSSNFTDAYYKFTGGGASFTDETSYTNGIDENNDFASLTIPSTYFSPPLTFRVGVSDGDQVELANDAITIVAVKPGADVDPQYMITPIAGGTQIKNKQGSITLQVQQSDSTGLTNITSGTDARLYKSDSSLLAVSMSGITDAGNGVVYNPTIDGNAIDGTLILELRDLSDNVLDTITLVDVSDGLGGGSFLAPSIQMTRTNGTTTYTPSFLSVTASFFSTSQTEYTSSFRIFATASGISTYTDNMYFDEGDQDPNISYTANNGDGTQFVGPGFANQLATKDLNIVATFTDPNTSKTITAQETFYVVSDGADGIDAITIVNTNQSHTLPASSTGVVSDYSNSGTVISIYEGITKWDFVGSSTPSPGEFKIGTPRLTPTSGITVGTIEIDGNTNASASNHSGMDNSLTSVVITYPITGSRVNGEPFLAETTQTITKAVAGVTTKALTITTDAGAFIFDDEFDNAAADDTIRVYINQQNLSGTVGTGDITIEAADATTLTTPTLTGTVTSGTGQQYFDLIFDTGSSGTGYITSKNKLPVSITVSKDSITDATSIAKLEGGASNAPMYFISPISGSQIKNGVGTLYLEILESGPGGINQITSGDKQLYVGNNLITSIVGVSGTAYAPVITATAINGQIDVLLKDGSTTYDSITLLDVTDGLGGGSFLSPTLNTTRTNGTTTYTPSFLSITASFFDVGASGVEHTSSFRFTPYFDGVDYFYYDLGYQDPNITFTINDGDGNQFTGTGFANKLPTKDVNITAIYTPVVPALVQSSTITETLYIVSDGQDGLDALTLISTNQAHTLPASSAGVVGNYTGSGTDITIYEGTSSLSYDGVGTSDGTWKIGTPYTTPSGIITVGSIIDGGDYATVDEHSNMNSLYTNVTITYPITGSRLTGGSFQLESVQTLTVTPAGASTKALTITSDSSVWVFDDVLDNAAADPDIRVYISQQNLSGTVGTGDITITDALSNVLTTPSLTGTVTSGTGQQYFDLTFDTGSSGTGYIDNKNRLPLSIAVSKDSITDAVTLAKLEGGASNAPIYFIKPVNGTQLKNANGTLELEVWESGPGALTQITSGWPQIYNGASLIAVGTGITDGGSGVTYNPVIDASAILGVLTLTLKDSGGTILDSITLVDVNDGLGGGSFIAPTMNTSRQTNNSYLPSFLSATASFFDAGGTEYSSSFKLTPLYLGGTDYFYYDEGYQDPNITYTINDGDGTDFAGQGSGNKLPTKDVSIVATFTDPATGLNSSPVIETFYIVSDGADGLDAITIINPNGSHTVPASPLGVVSSYTNSGTTLELYEGTTKLWYEPYTTTTLVSQSYLMDGYTAGDDTFNFVDDNIDTNAHSFSWVTSSAGTLYLYSAGNFMDVNTNDPLDYAEIVGFTNEGKYVSLTGDQVLGNDGQSSQPFIATLVTQANGSGATFSSSSINELSASSFTIWSSSILPTSAITVGSITDSGEYATIGDHSNMSAAANTVQIEYNIIAKRSNEFETNLTTTQTITKALGGSQGSAGSAGAAGAGVVYRGEWDSVTEYVATSERKDVVKYSTNTTNPYWIAKSTHTNQAPPASGTTGNTYWEGFGAQFTSVATDILFAQDVYANRTINVGTSGSSPVIALNSDAYHNGANPFISIGQVAGNQQYQEDGIYIGYDAGTAVASLQNTGGSKYIRWDGSDLTVKGTINADAGSIAGLTITDEKIYKTVSSNDVLLISESGYFKVGGPIQEFNQNIIASTGGVYNEYAGSGLPGDTLIWKSRASGQTYLYFGVTGSANIHYTFTNLLAETGGSYKGIQKNTGTWTNYVSTYTNVTSGSETSGVVTATSGDYRLVIYRNNSPGASYSSQISFYSSPESYLVFDPGEGQLTVGNSTLTAGVGDGKLTIGGTNPLELSNGNFTIDPAGNIDFRGTINAEGGSIGGFTITDTDLSADQINISSIGEIDVATGNIFIASGSLSLTGSNGTLRSSVGLVDTGDIRTDSSIPTTIYATTITAMTNAATVGATYKASFRLDFFDLYANGNGTFEINGGVNSARLQGYIDIYRNDGTTLITTYPFNKSVSSGLTTPSITYSGDTNYSFIFTSPATEILKYRLRYQISNVSISYGGGTVYNYDWSADVDNFTVVESIGKTEIRTGGLQVWKESTVYFKVNRNAANSSPSTPFIELATDGGYTGAGHLIPLASNTYDLGTLTTTTRRWRNVYAVNAYNTSDLNEKKNISGSNLGLNFIKSLNAVKYHWLHEEDNSPYHYGFIAQEVHEVAPKEEIAIINEVSGSWNMAYGELTAPIIKAIQELSEKVERLEAQISGSNIT